MPMNQEAISRGWGLLAGIRPKQSPCSAGVLPGLCIWKLKSISPLFPGPRGDLVANDWCINCCQLKAKVFAQSTGLPLDQACAGKECGYVN